MLGRLGWRGQCSCCNGPKDPKAVRAEEKRRWQREVGLVSVVEMRPVTVPYRVDAEHPPADFDG